MQLITWFTVLSSDLVKNIATTLLQNVRLLRLHIICESIIIFCQRVSELSYCASALRLRDSS